MKLDKYAGDYRLENITDKNGKLKTIPVYKGKYYSFIYEDKIAFARKHYLVFTALLLILYAVFFVLSPVTARKWYVLMPYACNFLPLFFLCASVYRLCSLKKAKLPGSEYLLPGSEYLLTREQNDKLFNRIALCTFLLMFFSGASLIGVIAAFITDGVMYSHDIVCCAFSVASVLISLHLFIIKEFTKAQEVKRQNNI